MSFKLICFSEKLTVDFSVLNVKQFLIVIVYKYSCLQISGLTYLSIISIDDRHR